MKCLHQQSALARNARYLHSRIGRGIAAAAFLGALAAPAAAQLDISAAAHASTLGWGLEGDILLTPHIGARAMYNWYSYSLTRTTDAGTPNQNTYTGTLTYKNIPLVIDYYLSAHGTFHVTGGIVMNQNKLDGVAALPWSYNGTTWTSADLVAPPLATITWPSVGWYAGFGWGTPFRKGSALGFVCDIGVMGGAPKVLLQATATNAGQDAQLQADLQQAADSIQHDLKTYATYYPVISLGISYRF